MRIQSARSKCGSGRRICVYEDVCIYISFGNQFPLHDAHTFYASPFGMFRIVFPVTVGSRMDHGRQVIHYLSVFASSQ